MANTKKLERPVRVGVKRSQRLKLKVLKKSLTKADKKKMVEDKLGLKAYLAKKTAEPAKA